MSSWCLAPAKLGEQLYGEKLAQIHWATPQEERAAFDYFKRHQDQTDSMVDCPMPRSSPVTEAELLVLGGRDAARAPRAPVRKSPGRTAGLWS